MHGLAETSSANHLEVSVTTTILSDRPADLEPTDRPVLAIVDLSHPAGAVPAPAIVAAHALGRPVKLVLLARRVGFSTDAALVAGAHQRLKEEREKVLAALSRQVPHLTGPVDLLWYARTPFGKPVEQARRAAQRAIRRYNARELILPPHLAAAARNDPADVGARGGERRDSLVKGGE
jgi:hypothetical protein